MADEAVLADRHQLTDERVGLHPGPAADDNALLDLHEGTDETVFADFAFVEFTGSTTVTLEPNETSRIWHLKVLVGADIDTS